MAFKKPNLCANDGQYISRRSINPPKSMLSIMTTPENRIIKASQGSNPGNVLNRKKKYKNEPIPSFRIESIISLTRGCLVNFPERTNTVCVITNILNVTKKN